MTSCSSTQVHSPLPFKSSMPQIGKQCHLRLLGKQAKGMPLQLGSLFKDSSSRHLAFLICGNTNKYGKFLFLELQKKMPCQHLLGTKSCHAIHLIWGILPLIFSGISTFSHSSQFQVRSEKSFFELWNISCRWPINSPERTANTVERECSKSSPARPQLFWRTERTSCT